jgi:hypothetical protein
LYDPWFGSRHGNIFLFIKISRLVLGPNQPPYSVGAAVPSREQSGLDVTVTTDLHIVGAKNDWSYTSSFPICLNSVYRGSLPFIKCLIIGLSVSRALDRMWTDVVVL